MSMKAWVRRAGLLAILVLPAGPAAAAADYGLVVDVTLSPKAQAELRRRNEAITVLAVYYGDPVPSKMYLNTPEGGIGIGTEWVTIPGRSGRAVVTGRKVERDHVGWVKSIDVLINVVSARRSDKNNLLDCAFFEGPLAQAQRKPIPISCRLIDGDQP